MQAPLDLLTPWIIVTAILIPLLYLERWIHLHLYGVGWLLTQDKERATIAYYFILLPGVFLHEFTQWVVAGALQLKTSKLKIWPKAQTNGSLRYDFVKLNKKTGRTATAVVELAPLVVGISIVLFISQRVFNVSAITTALNSGNLNVTGFAFEQMLGTPDFWLWLYLLFAIGNAMMPTPSERQYWPLLLVAFAIGAILLIMLGVGSDILLAALQGPLTNLLRRLSTAFSVILILDIIVVLILGTMETGIQKITGRNPAKYPKSKTQRKPKPEPGGELPLPAKIAPKPISERPLPIPPPPPMESKPQITPAEVKQLPISAKDNADDVSPQPAASTRQAASSPRPTYNTSGSSQTRAAPSRYSASPYGTTQPEPQAQEPGNIDDSDDLDYEDIEDIP